MENGQCDCRRNLIGRTCSEVQPGFFCAPLDYYKYEAEDATGHSPGDSVLPVSSVPVYTNLFLLLLSLSLFPVGRELGNLRHLSGYYVSLDPSTDPPFLFIF